MLHLSRKFSLLGKIPNLNLNLSKNKMFFSSRNPNEEGSHKVFIDEESIKEKMKQLKQKSETTTNQERKRKAKKNQFMPFFTIPEVNQKVQQFRKQTQTEDLFAFSEVTLQEKPTVLQITAYDQESFAVDNFNYPPSIILTNNQIFNWQISSSENLKVENFALLKCMRPFPRYVIVGVPDITQLSSKLKNELRKIHGNVDFLNLFQAISQYNTVANDDIFCVAFLANI